MSFGAFLSREERPGKTVTDLASSADISRATYYLLKKDAQRPSVLTAHRLLTALGYEARIPDPGGGNKKADLEFSRGGARYTLHLDWSDADRERSRVKLRKSAEAGMAASAGLGAGAGVAAMAAAAAPSVAAGIALPPWGAALAAAAAVKAVSVARKRQRAESADGSTEHDDQGPLPESALQDMTKMVDDLKAEAASLTPEELEALLVTMRAMRDGPQQ